VVLCLERGADLHMAQLMPLPHTVSCCSEVQIGFAFLVPAHPGSPGKRVVKWVSVYYIYILFACLYRLLLHLFFSLVSPLLIFLL